MLEALSLFSSVGTRKASKPAYSTKDTASIFAIALDFVICSLDRQVMDIPPAARVGGQCRR